MDSQAKSAIKTLVLDLRHTLEDELEIVLKRYGIFTDRAWPLQEPPDRLGDPIERQAWERIVTIVRQHIKEGRTIQQASGDYIREAAFTFLNRLVGLKCLEVRGIIDEVITTQEIYGGRSKQHRDYREEHTREARNPDDALPACIAEACQRVNDELIGYLFDPNDDYSLVWPRYPVLKGCIEKINALDAEVWKEDEIIGWIYQFYNAEEKVAIRKRGKPQTPHDVAVINQFFTPRWVVKFLVDNTLGRLWLEMHPDSPRVRQKCDYLVPEPLAVEEDAETGERKFQIAPESPINNPQAAPRRDPKPVTELKLLDPACGTMHFGYYAMEVFDAIYRDARDWGEVTIEDECIPGAILENNLFGVDIDRRAVQLAALSLFMKARTMHPSSRVRQVNMVVADAILPNGLVRQKFLERYKGDKAVQRAFVQVLEDMDQVAQVGSLLRVEERLKEMLAKAKHASVTKQLDFNRQQDLPGFTPPARQMGLAEAVPDEQKAGLTPHLTLQELRDDLRRFARKSLDEHDVTGQLFATEADKAMRLLDVLMADYDVVVMNPPYGSSSKEGNKYLDKTYPNTKNDLYAGFIERSKDFLTRNSGYIGSLTSRTFLQLPTFENLRKIILEKSKPIVIADLGFSVLDDALVETAASVFCFSGNSPNENLVCINLTQVPDAKRANELHELLRHEGGLSSSQIIYRIKPKSISKLPRKVFAYWAPASTREHFSRYPQMAKTLAVAKTGLQTDGDEKYIRFHWEVKPDEIGEAKKWVPFAKGGDYSKYYSDVYLVVYWENNGYVIKKAVKEKWGSASKNVRNEGYYYQEGLTYPATTVKGINVRYMAPGNIFGLKGPAIFPLNKENLWYVLGLMNSTLILSYLRLLTPSRSFDVTAIGLLPVVKNASELLQNQIGYVAKESYRLKAEWDRGNETSTSFDKPWILKIVEKSRIFPLNEAGGFLGEEYNNQREVLLPKIAEHLFSLEQLANNYLQSNQGLIDTLVYELYAIPERDRSAVIHELGNRPAELVWPQMEGKSKSEKQSEHVKRFFSYYTLCAVRTVLDGIIPLKGGSARQSYLIDNIRTQMEKLFGAQAAYQFEHDAAEYLGRSLEEWVIRDFFVKFHIKLYKNHPVLWHLTSPKGYFAVMVDYHRMDRDTLPKVQSLYLWPQMEAARTRLNAVRQNGAPAKTLADLEDELADLKDCDERLSAVIQGTIQVDLPEWAHGPYRGGKPPYDPDLDDGVRVNLLPIQEAGLLPVKKVV